MKGMYVGRDERILEVGTRGKKPVWRDTATGKGDRGRKTEGRKGKKKDKEDAVQQVNGHEEVEDPDWQDMREYEMEQEDVVHDIGEREPEDMDEEMEVKVEAMETEKPKKSQKEKAERKKRKKERSKKEGEDVKAERKKRKKEARQKDIAEKGRMSSKTK
jgi:hypothetical protein